MATKRRRSKKKRLPRISWKSLIIAGLVLFAILASRHEILRVMRSSYGPIVETVETIVELFRNQPPPDPGSQLDDSLPQVKVCFIDVGQGDGILIQGPEANVLIDGGTPANGVNVWEVLQENDVEHLDCIINTHPHSDHVGGLPQVIRFLGEGNVDEVWVADVPPSLEPNNQSWPQLLEEADRCGAQVIIPEPGRQLDLGEGAMLTVIGPIQLYDDDLNNVSIVCRVDLGEASYLFTGDTSTGPLYDLATAGIDLECDILQAPHHGSRTSTDSMTLQFTRPKAAVISCGAENDYGHPNREVTDLLRNRNILTLRTDLQGDVWIATDGENFQIDTQRGQQEPVLLSAS